VKAFKVCIWEKDSLARCPQERTATWPSGGGQQGDSAQADDSGGDDEKDDEVSVNGVVVEDDEGDCGGKAGRGRVVKEEAKSPFVTVGAISSA